MHNYSGQPCSVLIQIRQTQTFTGPRLFSERTYTIAELCALWHREPKTLYNWLWMLRRSGRGPRPEQARRRRMRGRSGAPSPFRRALEIRSDYVRVMAELCLEQVLRRR